MFVPAPAAQPDDSNRIGPSGRIAAVSDAEFARPPLFEPPLRALQIGNTAAESGGGAERYYFSLLRALPNCGVRGSGLVYGESQSLAHAPAVRSFCAEGAGFLARCSGIRRGVQQALPECDVVVSHFAPYALPVLDVIRRLPLVVHFHGSWALEGAYEGAGRFAVAAKRAIERIVYSRGSRFIVLSQASSTILEREYGVSPDGIRIIPGGVDMRRFAQVCSRREARRTLGWPTDRPTIVTVRRLVRSKGLENLIAAIDLIRHDIPDVLLVIAGSGPLEAELRRQVADLQLARWVHFIGQVGDDLAIVYRAADLSIVPSVALEGFGLVVIEALACGTPTLVTPVTGLPEVVNGLDPQLVLPGVGPGDIARGLTAALGGQTALPSTEACIAYAAGFDWPVIAARVAAVYREVA